MVRFRLEPTGFRASMGRREPNNFTVSTNVPPGCWSGLCWLATIGFCTLLLLNGTSAWVTLIFFVIGFLVVSQVSNSESVGVLAKIPEMLGTLGIRLKPREQKTLEKKEVDRKND
jgi:hypothetical protein